MSFDQSFETVVKNFVSNFNQMCRATGRDYLVRADNPKGENPKEKTYRVEYKYEKLGYGWSIYAESRRFFIFSVKFPFITIEETNRNRLKLSGLFTESMPAVNRNPTELDWLLQKYLVYCRNIPVESFVRV